MFKLLVVPFFVVGTHCSSGGESETLNGSFDTVDTFSVTNLTDDCLPRKRVAPLT